MGGDLLHLSYFITLKTLLRSLLIFPSTLSVLCVVHDLREQLQQGVLNHSDRDVVAVLLLESVLHLSSNIRLHHTTNTEKVVPCWNTTAKKVAHHGRVWRTGSDSCFVDDYKGDCKFDLKLPRVLTPSSPFSSRDKVNLKNFEIWCRLPFSILLKCTP